LCQRVAVDVLHLDEPVAFDLLEVKRAADVRVRDLLGEPDLIAKALESVCRAGELGRDRLEGHLAHKGLVDRQVDCTHPALPQDAKDAVALTEPLGHHLAGSSGASLVDGLAQCRIDRSPACALPHHGYKVTPSGWLLPRVSMDP